MRDESTTIRPWLIKIMTILMIVLFGLFGIVEEAEAWTYSIDGSNLTLTLEESDVASMTTGWRPYIWYDFDNDDDVFANLTNARYTENFNKIYQPQLGNTQGSVSIPMQPEYHAYLVGLQVYNGSWNLRPLSPSGLTYALVINQAASVVIENTEPQPVRIAELGSNGTTPTTISNELPTSLDASISIDGTIPVDPWSSAGLPEGWQIALVYLMIITFGGGVAYAGLRLRR